MREKTCVIASIVRQPAQGAARLGLKLSHTRIDLSANDNGAVRRGAT